MSIAMSIGMEVQSEITSNDTTSSSSATSWLLMNSANCLAFLTEYSVPFVRKNDVLATYLHSVTLAEYISLKKTAEGGRKFRYPLFPPIDNKSNHS